MARSALALIAWCVLLVGSSARAAIWTSGDGSTMIARDSSGKVNTVTLPQDLSGSTQSSGNINTAKAATWNIADPRVPRTLAVPVTETLTLPKAMVAAGVAATAFATRAQPALAILGALANVAVLYRAVDNQPVTNTPSATGTRCSSSAMEACSCSAVGATGEAGVLNDAGTSYVWGTWNVFAVGADSTGWRQVQNCTNLPSVGGLFPRLATKPDTSGTITGAPISESQLGTVIGNYIAGHPISNDLYQAILQWLQANKNQATGSASGSATSSDPATTSAVTTNGTTVTTTTTNTYTTTVTGDTYNIVNTVSNTNNGGLPTTTTTNNYTNSGQATAPQPATGSGGGSETPPFDWCKAHPDASGCTPLGADPGSVEVGHQDVPTTLEADSGWGPDTAGCPAPVPLTAFGKSYSMSWEPVCKFADGLRPVVVAVGWISAVSIFVGMGRKAG